MSAMSTLKAEVDDFEAKLHAGASHLVDEFKSLVAKLIGEGEADVTALAGDAETAVAPVVETAKAEGGQLVKDAVVGAEAIASDPAAPSA